eukprot:2942599-Alexandrium_andersonii.AAC.1
MLRTHKRPSACLRLPRPSLRPRAPSLAAARPLEGVPAWTDEDRGRALQLLPREAGEACEPPQRAPIASDIPDIWIDS